MGISLESYIRICLAMPADMCMRRSMESIALHELCNKRKAGQDEHARSFVESSLHHHCDYAVAEPRDRRIFGRLVRVGEGSSVVDVSLISKFMFKVSTSLLLKNVSFLLSRSIAWAHRRHQGGQTGGHSKWGRSKCGHRINKTKIKQKCKKHKIRL